MLFGTVRPFVASLDVVGHELSHGVTEKTAGLIYELQSGALNEAFSDIFGEMVEARARGVNDWLLGSELAKPIRNMKNPGALIIGGLNKPFPSRMSEFLVLPNTDDADRASLWQHHGRRSMQRKTIASDVLCRQSVGARRLRSRRVVQRHRRRRTLRASFEHGVRRRHALWFLRRQRADMVRCRRDQDARLRRVRRDVWRV